MKKFVIDQQELNATIDLIHKGKFDLQVSSILNVLKILHSLKELDSQESVEDKELKAKKNKG